MNRNPFTQMLLTFVPDRVYGRQNEIISILQVITSAEPNSHALYGIRAIGKTMLLKYLKEPNGALIRYEDYVHVDYRRGGSKRLLFIYVNLHDFENDFTIFHTMLWELQNEIENDELAGEIHIEMFDEASSRQEVVNILRSVLGQLQTYGVRVIFLLDDFDVPLEYLDGNDDRLLRSLSHEAVLIITTEAPISELRPDIGKDSPLLGILRPEAINLLNDASARQLICDSLREVGIQFSETEQNFLIHMAGRQPFLLTVACELYFDMRNNYPDVADMLHNPNSYTSVQVQFMYRLAGLPHVDNLLHRTWNRLSQEERQVLFAMTEPENTPVDLSLSSTAVRLANKSLAYLDIAAGRYRVFSQVFANYIRLNHQKHFMGKTQPVRKTASQVVENLSPVDKALLEYFLRHRNRVCTFEELLDAVWEDGDKSKRALEAAVFRLRKNLSSDEQIKNIRGRGYKFLSQDVRNGS